MALLATIITIGLIFLLYLIVDLNNLNSKLKSVESDRHMMVQKADELRQSSDDLSRFAKAYVITKDETYKKNYYEVLSIRNGETKRPKNY